MAERAAGRAVVAEAENALRPGPWQMFCESRGGNGYAYDDVLSHAHPAHGPGSLFDARTGKFLGLTCYVVLGDAPTAPTPSVCPICRDVRAGVFA